MLNLNSSKKNHSIWGQENIRFLFFTQLERVSNDCFCDLPGKVVIFKSSERAEKESERKLKFRLENGLTETIWNLGIADAQQHLAWKPQYWNSDCVCSGQTTKLCHWIAHLHAMHTRCFCCCQHHQHCCCCCCYCIASRISWCFGMFLPVR